MDDKPNKILLPELDFSQSERRASLSAIYGHALGLAQEAEGYYARKRPNKRLAGRVLRVTTVALGAVAAVLPIVSEITADDGSPEIAPGWSTVALVLAAALITLDHFFGFSSAWMRFMEADLRITSLRHAFEHAWNARLAMIAATPTEEDVKACLALADAFVQSVDAVVAEETASWVSEFRAGLQQTEERLASGVQ